MTEPKGRQSARTAAARRHKRDEAAEGRAACEVCGWTAPAALVSQPWELLNTHHVVPVAAGGSDEAGNLVVLCPNHHAIAHRATFTRRGRYYGPRTRAELLAELREIDADADAWRQRMRGAAGATLAAHRTAHRTPEG